uniref:Uncharacterized protein n=1 Tax=Oryza nivara TaxID=4536 RepID=A0A0E0HIZ5_ORYNI
MGDNGGAKRSCRTDARARAAGRPNLTPSSGARRSCGCGAGARAAGWPDLTPGGGAKRSCGADAGARATMETGGVSAPTPGRPGITPRLLPRSAPLLPSQSME